MKILLHGKDITELVSRLTFNSSIDSLSTTCDITVPQFKDTDFFVNVELPSKIEISTDEKIFTGVVVDISTSDDNYCNIKSMDVAFYLNRNKVFKQSRNVSGSNFIKSIASEFGLTVDIKGLDTVVNKIYKNESVSDIIRDIAKIDFDKTGKEYCIYVKDTTIHINEIGSESANLIFKLSNDDELNDKSTVIAYQLSKNIEDLVNAVSVYSDDDKSTKILAKKEDNDSISKFGRIHEVVELQALEVKKANEVASKVIESKSKIKETLSITVATDTYVFAGQSINYNNKKYCITSVDIEYNNNYFTGNLQLLELI